MYGVFTIHLSAICAICAICAIFRALAEMIWSYGHLQGIDVEHQTSEDSTKCKNTIPCVLVDTTMYHCGPIYASTTIVEIRN